MIIKAKLQYKIYFTEKKNFTNRKCDIYDKFLIQEFGTKYKNEIKSKLKLKICFI
jgi:hypothetical protein